MYICKKEKGQFSMKKFLSFLLVAIITISMCAVCVCADEKTVRARDLNRSALTEYIDGVKVTTLAKSKTEKKAKLKLSCNEMLIVGKNVTLSLYKGADISGTVYVENGGKLLLAGGEITVSESGTVFADGTISINKAAALNVVNGGTVFVGKSGTMRATTEKSLAFDEFSNIVCIGKTNSKNSCIARKTVDAYIYENGELQTAPNPSEFLTNGNDDYCTDLVKKGKNNQRLILVFDSGACIKAEKVNDRFASFGGCKVSIIGMKQKNSDSYISYSRIYEINGTDYVYDMNGVTEFIIDEKGIVSGYENIDNSAISKALKKLSEKNYIGKFPNGNAKMYRNSDGSILVIWKNTDDNALDVSNDNLYSAARLVEIP